MPCEKRLEFPRLVKAAVILVLAAAGIVGHPSISAGPAPAPLEDFLQRYCIECHGAEKQKGDRRFDRLSLPIAQPDDLTEIADIIDQLNLGDMPPKKARQPAAAERNAVVATLTKTVAEARAALKSIGGHTVLRRLNRTEYVHTVGDLFALDMRAFDPTTRFPRDETADHLDNLGDVLRTSGYLLSQYLDAADQVVEKALGVTRRPEEKTWTFNGNFQQQPELSYSHGRVYKFRYLCLYEVPDTDKQEGGYGPIHGFERGAPCDGFYEIKVLAQAMNRHHPYDPAIFGRDTEAPFRLGIVPGDVKAGPLHHTQPLEPELAEVVVRDGEPEWHVMTVWLDAGRTPRFIFPNGMSNCRETFQKLARSYRSMAPDNDPYRGGIVEARRIVLQYGQMPHIRIHEVRIRGPITNQWPPASQRALLGDQPFQPARTRELLRAFADRAYRRPARPEEVDRLMDVVEARSKAGSEPFAAFKDGLKAALCSPAFLYLDEAPDADGTLEAHSFATRLSYFLWSSMPDPELRALAESRALLQPDIKRAQLHRLLASPKSDAFVEGFLNTWLNLRSLGDMPPDREVFGHYYSQGLQTAMKRETQLFMRHLLDANESLVSFLDADYTFVNQPLATLYGLGRICPPEEAHEFHRVSLTDRRRGGLLGQGSVLTVSANGIETSPVTRGVWLLENILGTPPAPPPDNVPPIDPDIRGASSIRDIITKHRDNPTCFQCHQKIDPLGFALENFDPIGAWRDHYKSGKTQGAAIDSSGELPNGRAFQDITGLKQILVSRQKAFAKVLTEKLLAYACGRRLEVLGRPDVDHIVAQAARDNYGLRRLVELIVLSETFARK